MRAATRWPAGADLPGGVVRDLVYGWGNESWSARGEFLGAVLAHAWKADGPVLECGSGLTTLLLGLVAERTGHRVWSLEHNPFWAERVRAELKRYRIGNVEVCPAALGDRGGYSWYAAPRERLPETFALVVCDGPPGDTPGGRYGLVPEMRSRLAPGCVLLLDDADRPDERAVLARWAGELGAAPEVLGAEKPFARLIVP